MVIGTKVQNPRRELNRICEILAVQMKATMCSSREGKNATIWAKESKEFCFNIWADCMTAAGFIDISDRRGVLQFTTTSMDVVKNVFDCLPNGRSPFTNFSPMKSEGVFYLSKSCSGFAGFPLVHDLRKARLPELRESAVYELILTENEAAELKRVQLIEMLANQRILEKTYVGMASIYRVFVNELNPMGVTVTPGRCGQALIQVSFTVTKWDTIFDAGQPPQLTKIYGPDDVL